MVDPLGVAGIAVDVAPQAARALNVIVGRGSVAKLRGFVAGDLRGAHEIAAGRRKAIANVWESEGVDPDLSGALTLWLASGDASFLRDAMGRWRVIISDRDLALDGGELDAIVTVTMASLRRNFARAQPNEIAAIHAEAERILHAIDASADAIGRLGELLRARPTAAVRARKRVRFNLQAQPVAYAFAGRDAELGLIERALKATERAVVTQAITGLGGVGKSQLAARYLQLHADEYEIVAWIRAQDGGVADLAQLAEHLQIVEDSELAPAERAQRAITWLSECEQTWLVVLDNVESAEQLAGLLPQGSCGRVVITSRDRSLRQFGALLTVDVFDEDTATDYLVKRAARAHDKAAARTLAQALGGLPLALAHAGAYCADGTSFSDYRRQLVGLPARELFDTHPEAFYERTVASTWKTSIAAAVMLAPLAGELLELAAYLAPDAIPKTLLASVLDDRDAIGEQRRLTDALNALARYSLATIDDSTLGVHRLLQKVIRDDLTERDERTPAGQALTSVAQAFPEDVALHSTWDTCEQLLAHVQTLPVTLPDPNEHAPRLFALLNRACVYLLHAQPGTLTLMAGDIAAQPQVRVVTISQDTAAHAVRILGDEHPGTLTARANLASSYWSAGRTADAIELEERVLADSVRILGDEHPDTLTARANLASSYWSAGRTADAIELQERVLADRVRILGDEHPGTLTARANLALSYWSAGRTADAIELQERVLADRVRILGDEHPGTLTARANLASSYWSAGRTADAIELQERVLADSVRILGDEHPGTLTARANLASSYWSAGRTADAIELEERVLADSVRILGDEHPGTLTARANLASSYWSAGRTADAIELQERVLADSVRILGDEHPHVATRRANLEVMTTSAGSPDPGSSAAD